MRKLTFLCLLYVIEASPISPGLNTWFSAFKLSRAGGGSLIFSPNSRSANLASSTSKRCFSTSFVLYPAGIQAQSASIFIPKKSKLYTAAINHISYGTFNGYTENAVPTDNYTSSETWLRFDYSSLLNEYPIRYGVSNQFYFSKFEKQKATNLHLSFGVIWNIEKYKTNIGLSIDDFFIKLSSDSKTNENPPLKYNIGLSKKLNYLPLEVSLDYLSIATNNQDYFISGTFLISKQLSLNWGTSTRKFSQNTYENVLKTILGSSGFGFSFMKNDVTLCYGLYFYGTGGLVSGVDLLIKF